MTTTVLGPAHDSESDRRSPPVEPDGTLSSPPPRASLSTQAVTCLILFGPLLGVAFAAVSMFGRGVTTLDLVLAGTLYLVTGHGLSAGYHRLFGHRAFSARRWPKIVLAVAGSLAFEGSPIGWAANHRRHHAYTDRPGDPHSPYSFGTMPWGRVRGAVHAHIGWLFRQQPTDGERWVADLRRDPDLVAISRWFPAFCVASLGLPTLLGWLFTGTFEGAVGGLVWGGLVRVFLLHQATFAVNSAGHLWGKRPYRTRASDRATNFAPLAILSMGDNWHNNHHSSPRLARHGVDRGQLDSTARLIWVLERMHAVSSVRWPDPAVLASRRK